MARVRTVLPTDLVALAGYDGRVSPNEAITRDRVGTRTSPHLLETAIEQWFSFATGRHTWISVKGVTLRGLASARRRGAKTAWEVDCLIHTEEEDDDGVLMSLLDRVVEGAGRAGAEKIFLRVPADSETAHIASGTGFIAYQTETLVVLDNARDPQASDPPPALRRWSRADGFATFRLYNHWTPEAVRSIEAPTYQDWVASRERLSSGRPRRWVVEREGNVEAWLRVAADGDVGRFEVMAEPELLDSVIDAALARLSEQSSVLTLVPEFATGLRERLERRGFCERDSFSVLARRTTRRVEAPELAPAVPVPSVPA